MRRRAWQGGHLLLAVITFVTRQSPLKILQHIVPGEVGAHRLLLLCAIAQSKIRKEVGLAFSQRVIAGTSPTLRSVFWPLLCWMGCKMALPIPQVWPMELKSGDGVRRHRVVTRPASVFCCSTSLPLLGDLYWGTRLLQLQLAFLDASPQLQAKAPQQANGVTSVSFTLSLHLSLSVVEQKQHYFSPWFLHKLCKLSMIIES